MYIGANVLLPRDYHENPGARYPVIYLQGHFPGRRAPFNFSEADDAPPRARAFRDFWLSPRAPRVIAVTIRDANPYYDTSYSVNSANVGPYGDAIVEELTPSSSAASASSRSRGRGCWPAARPAAGKRSRCRSSTRTRSAAPGAGARPVDFRRLPARRTSTRTRTRTTRTTSGCASSGPAARSWTATWTTRSRTRTRSSA